MVRRSRTAPVGLSTAAVWVSLCVSTPMTTSMSSASMVSLLCQGEWCLSVPVRATLWQDCEESRCKADELLIRPTHGDRAGAGGQRGHVPFRAPRRADQYLGHAPTTGHQPQAPTSGTGGSETHS